MRTAKLTEECKFRQMQGTQKYNAQRVHFNVPTKKLLYITHPYHQHTGNDVSLAGKLITL
jgi:hypothetical protein